jgi:hypothetical protein
MDFHSQMQARGGRLRQVRGPLDSVIFSPMNLRHFGAEVLPIAFVEAVPFNFSHNENRVVSATRRLRSMHFR